MMLEEGEIDEEELKIDDYDRLVESKSGDHEDNSCSPKPAQKPGKRSRNKKRGKKSSHHHDTSPQMLPDDLDRPSEDKDERILPPPTVAKTAAPISLFDLFKNTSEALLVNPVITEKENKPSSLLTVEPTANGSGKRQQADLKRKVPD